MANDEVLEDDFVVHPAFENGVTGFWVMVEPAGTVSSIDGAINNAKDVKAKESHLMKNTEYAAAVFLLKYLENEEIVFNINEDGNTKEYVAAVFDSNSTYANFNSYSVNSESDKYYKKYRGHALFDTPWNIKKDLILPNGEEKYIVRDVENGGLYYFEAVDENTTAAFRRVIPE